jgi:hypothetical protein
MDLLLAKLKKPLALYYRIHNTRWPCYTRVLEAVPEEDQEIHVVIF